MQTPPNSNLPTPRSPRDKDEWIAVVIALGILGGTAGWIVTNSSSALRTDGVGANLFGLGQLAAPLEEDRTEAETAIDRADDDDATRSSRDAGDADTDTQSNFQGFLDDDDARQSLADDEPSGRISTPTTTPAVDDEQQPTAIAVDPDETDVDESAEEPEITDSVEVPEPRVPEDIATNDEAPAREPLAFSDLPEDHWGKPYIDALTARGVLNGLPDGTYAPDRPMTRAELAVQVAQAFDVNRELPSETFTDIPDDYWAAETIDEAVTTGFMTGYPNDVFQPDQTVPRTQVLVTLATGLDLATDGITTTEVLQPYEDQSEIPAWATAKVASAIEAGLIDASPDTTTQLRPNTPATRAEVAAMLYNALLFIGEVEPIE